MSNYGSTPPPPQPAYGGGSAQGAPPPNYLVWAILSLFMCMPIAIASIIFSTQVNSKWAMGDVAGAQAASEKAKKFAIGAAIAGVVIIIAYFMLALLGGMMFVPNP